MPSKLMLADAQGVGFTGRLHSHDDSEFAETLAAHLIKSNTHVWIDKWELHVGDSLVQRIQDAIGQANAIVVILSRASIQSAWCKKELTAGLVRELEEKRVVVLPVVIEACEIPLFLRDKKYADFRQSFDSGLRDVREALARVTSVNQARIDRPKWYTDWATSYYTFDDGRLALECLLVEQVDTQPYTVICRLMIFLNPTAIARHEELLAADAEPFARQLILEGLMGIPDLASLQVLIPDADPVTNMFIIRDTGSTMEYEVEMKCQRLGADTGRGVILTVGQQLIEIVAHVRRTVRAPTGELRERLQFILGRYRASKP